MAPNANRPTVTLHVVSSLDGFIARKDNTVSWLESPADAYKKRIAEQGAAAAEAMKAIDCFVLGSRT